MSAFWGAHFISCRVCGQLDQQYCLVLMGMKLQHEDTADFTMGDADVFLRASKPRFPTLPSQNIFGDEVCVFS